MPLDRFELAEPSANLHIFWIPTSLMNVILGLRYCKIRSIKYPKSVLRRIDDMYLTHIGSWTIQKFEKKFQE